MPQALTPQQLNQILSGVMNNPMVANLLSQMGVEQTAKQIVDSVGEQALENISIEPELQSSILGELGGLGSGIGAGQVDDANQQQSEQPQINAKQVMALFEIAFAIAAISAGDPLAVVDLAEGIQELGDATPELNTPQKSLEEMSLEELLKLALDELSTGKKEQLKEEMQARVIELLLDDDFLLNPDKELTKEQLDAVKNALEDLAKNNPELEHLAEMSDRELQAALRSPAFRRVLATELTTDLNRGHEAYKNPIVELMSSVIERFVDEKFSQLSEKWAKAKEPYKMSGKDIKPQQITKSFGEFGKNFETKLSKGFGSLREQVRLKENLNHDISKQPEVEKTQGSLPKEPEGLEQPHNREAHLRAAENEVVIENPETGLVQPDNLPNTIGVNESSLGLNLGGNQVGAGAVTEDGMGKQFAEILKDNPDIKRAVNDNLASGMMSAAQEVSSREIGTLSPSAGGVRGTQVAVGVGA